MNKLPNITIIVQTPVGESTDVYTAHITADYNGESLASYVADAAETKDMQKLQALLWLIHESNNIMSCGANERKANAIYPPSLLSPDIPFSPAEEQQDWIYRIGHNIYLPDMSPPICFLLPMPEKAHRLFPDAGDLDTFELTSTGTDVLYLENEGDEIQLIGWPTVIDDDNRENYYTGLSIDKLTYTDKHGREMDCTFSFKPQQPAITIDTYPV